MTIKSALTQVTGIRPFTKTPVVIKATLLHQSEQLRFAQIKAHPAQRLSPTSETSMSLVMRRALAHYALHLDGIPQDDIAGIAQERAFLARMTHSGSPYRTFFHTSAIHS